MFAEKGIPAFIAYGVYAGEIPAPVLMIIGYRTKLASLVLIVNMLIIIFVVHPSDIFALTQYGAWKLEQSGLYLFSALALLFTGAGKYSVSSYRMCD